MGLNSNKSDVSKVMYELRDTVSKEVLKHHPLLSNYDFHITIDDMEIPKFIKLINNTGYWDYDFTVGLRSYHEDNEMYVVIGEGGITLDHNNVWKQLPELEYIGDYGSIINDYLKRIKLNVLMNKI